MRFYYIYKISTFNFQYKSLSIVSSITCNSKITLGKQGQEHNNLSTIHKEKVKGAHECPMSLQFVKT